MKQIFMFTLFALMGFGNAYALQQSAVLGKWKNQSGDGLIEITTHKGILNGIIIGSPDEKNRKDSNNPDPMLQARSLKGVQILGDLRYHKNNEWQDGWIYDPGNGKTYQCYLKLIAINTLEIRGYVVVPLFGRTETWTRFTDPLIKTSSGE